MEIFWRKFFPNAREMLPYRLRIRDHGKEFATAIAQGFREFLALHYRMQYARSAVKRMPHAEDIIKTRKIVVLGLQISTQTYQSFTYTMVHTTKKTLADKV